MSFHRVPSYDGLEHAARASRGSQGSLQAQGAIDPKDAKAAFYAVVLAAIISSVTAATLGYDVGVMADAIVFIGNDMQLNSGQTQIIVGSLNFIAAFGTLIAGSTADRFGRKPTVAVCCVMYVVGSVVMAIAPEFWTLLLGRIVTGLGVGVAFVVTPVYIAEITPSEARGQLATCFDISINVGILIGYVVGFGINSIDDASNGLKWRLMLGLGGVLPVFVISSLVLLPESPRWLMTRGRDSEAKTVLVEFLGSDVLATETIDDIRMVIEAESQDPLSWYDFLFPKEKYLRDILWLVIGVGFWQQATGSEAVLYYSSAFLENAGLVSTNSRLLGYIAIGLCKLIPEIIVMNYVDHAGRRPLLVLSSATVTLCIVALGLTFLFNWPSYVVVVLLCVYMWCFSSGMGPVTWLAASEFTPLRQRAKGMTTCSFVNRLVSGTVALSTLSTCDAMGYTGFFFFYGGISAIGTAFYYFYVPETKGRSLEQITLDFKLRAGEGDEAKANGSPVENPISGQAS